MDVEVIIYDLITLSLYTIFFGKILSIYMHMINSDKLWAHYTIITKIKNHEY